MKLTRRADVMARRRRSRWSAAVAVAAALSFVLAACSSNGSTSSAAASSSNSGTPVDGGTLNVSFWMDNANLLCVDPFQTYWIEHRSEIENFTDSLTYQTPANGQVIPHLATSWTISPAGKTYTFNLRTGVTFSNGAAFNAAAVVANVNGWLATKKEVPGAYGDSYITNVTGAKAIDANTVRSTSVRRTPRSCRRPRRQTWPFSRPRRTRSHRHSAASARASSPPAPSCCRVTPRTWG